MKISKNWETLFLNLLTFTVVFSVSFQVKAQSITGYPCNVEYLPTSEEHGNHGYFILVLNEGRRCAGISVGFFFFCSEGATSRFCTSDSAWHFSRDNLHLLFNNSRSHLTTNRRMTVAIAPGCSDSHCGGSIRFWAN